MAVNMFAMPTRGTSEYDLDQWNRTLRASPVYLDYMRANNLSTDGRVKLSRAQQSGLESALARSGMKIPGGMHIDQGGNLNQKNRLVRNTAIGAGIGAGTLLTAGAFGLGPLSGLYGGGGAATAAGSTVLPSTTSGIGTTAGYGTLFGGAGASSVPSVVGPTVSTVAPAAKTGILAGAGKFFSGKGGELAVNSALNLYGMRQQNKAAEQARADTLAATREAATLARQQFEAELENARLDREDARAAQAALNELKKRELDAAEEERAYNRSVAEEDRSLKMARESRLAPYRAISERAMGRLASMWGL